MGYTGPSTFLGQGQSAADPSLASYHGYILLTASFERVLSSEEQVVRALTIPCLAKPFEMDELHRMVCSVEQRFTPPVQPEQQAS